MICPKCGMTVRIGWESQHGKWCTGFAAGLNEGVLFESACSGLWYRNRLAAGDISAVRIDGVMFKKVEGYGNV